MGESRETRIKRLRMRSMRRGIREMDLVLSAFADARLADMSDVELDIYDALLSENDHDLYQWITGQASTSAPYTALVSEISALSQGLTRDA
jgi:antitoxin CptB